MDSDDGKSTDQNGSKAKDNGDLNSQYGGPPVIFMSESCVFGNRKPDQDQWIKHGEMYEALSDVISASHITGLQRVRGMWRIYLDNLEDKIALLTEGAHLRGKHIKFLHTNPNRLDGENTTRVRIKDIPLSVHDDIITRALILKGLDVISTTREKLRFRGKLTNCDTGDRLCLVKASTLNAPLAKFMAFGHFTGRVVHPGQNKDESRSVKCRKCLQDGHKAADCTGDWVCLDCGKPGHKRGQCDIPSEEPDRSDNDHESPEPQPCTLGDNVNSDNNCPSSDQEDTVPVKKRATKKGQRAGNQSGISGQKPIDRFMISAANSCETPNKGKQSIVVDRSPPTPAEVLNDESKKTKTGIANSTKM